MELSTIIILSLPKPEAENTCYRIATESNVRLVDIDTGFLQQYGKGDLSFVRVTIEGTPFHIREFVIRCYRYEDNLYE